MYDIKEYKDAYSIEEALQYLNDKPTAKIIAGGTDVLIRSKEGKLPDASLMGINRIESMKKVWMDDESTIHIGPAMAFSALEKDSIINEHIPSVGEAGGCVGGPQIRNVATIGGNVCNGAPSADSASILFCYNAQLLLKTLKSERIIPIADFYQGPGRVDLREGEMLCDIMIAQADYKGYEGRYMKFSQREAMDIATLGCAVLVKRSETTFEDVRIAYAVAAPTPIRCPHTESLAKGAEISIESIKAISETVLKDIKARDSWRGSKAYREQLAKVLCHRGIARIVGLGECDRD